ncbi:hypothetical protein FZEAL_164 [Fusarium zealandicum]|uniref:Uncharacterized protein n=1 Tax=Fusarium zealandicum TaxID=1053134 RepID=A0A8H4XQ43_9HYPO|nr:hypothetical protein FZEAL_164 [Fusarium zealandicum]
MPSSSPPGPSGRTIPIILLGILSLLALDALMLQLNRSGYSDFLIEILDDPNPRFLPGSERLLLRRYSGVPALDRFFALWNVVWANVADGSRPQLSLFAFCFGAQMVSFFSVLMVESQRVAGWSGLVLNPLVWGLAMQFLGFGFIAPLYFIVHLVWTSRSSWSENVHLQDPACLRTMRPAFLLGYILPCALIAYPFPQHDMRQWINVIWAVFPIYVLASQTLFTNLLKRMSVGQNAWAPKVQLDKDALSHAYGFAWNVAVVGQMTTYAVLIAANIFPGAFPDGVARSLTMSKVFVPDAPHSYKPMTDAASAMHNFFIYDLYIGSAAALIWAAHLLLQIRPELSSGEERANLARGVLTSILLSGPGGALVALLQHRDDTVLTAEAKADKSK